jgi:hypothetical protein
MIHILKGDDSRKSQVGALCDILKKSTESSMYQRIRQEVTVHLLVLSGRLHSMTVFYQVFP